MSEQAEIGWFHIAVWAAECGQRRYFDLSEYLRTSPFKTPSETPSERLQTASGGQADTSRQCFIWKRTCSGAVGGRDVLLRIAVVDGLKRAVSVPIV